MNTNILKKVIDELKVDDPDISYILGILETLLEMQSPAIESSKSTASGSSVRLPINLSRPPETPHKETSEADILEKQAHERLKNVTDLAH